MGSCLQPLVVPLDTEEQTLVHNNSQCSQALYQLNDLRSLEGVARLWSDRMQKQSFLKQGVRPLQNATSVRVQGTHKHNPFANFSISTYYFVHAPKASNQPNLLHSHSAPPKLTRAALGNIIQTSNSIKDKKSASVNIHSTETDKWNNDQFIEMDLPTTDVKYNTSSDHSNRKFTLSPIQSPSTANNANWNSLQPPESPQFPIAQNLPHHMAMGAMVPVFSFSNSLASENVVIDDIGSNSNGFRHLNLTLDEHIGSNKISNDCFAVKNTYSNRNVLRLKNNLTTNDFMEYETRNAFNAGVGFGASGIVKKAFHFSSCKMVAIKQCRSKQSHEITAFEREAKLYNKIFAKNENIIDIIGFGKGDINNELLMALEYMDLGSIESLKISQSIADMKQRELCVRYIARNVLRALDDLHSNLYVHNDIKPQNILANKLGQIKLSDFGTVLRLQSLGDYSFTNNGTQRYQSPEKMIFAIKYNSKNDIWSFGITLFELIFGCNAQENDIKYATDPPILDVNDTKCRGLSKHCCDFINACLTVDQFDRPSASELLTHKWFKTEESVSLKEKWPWFIEEFEYENNEGRNEDLLFMISALIIYYSSKEFDSIDNGSIGSILHRRVSKKPTVDDDGNVSDNVRIYSDEERIENMAKYALCSKDTVMDRITVTVSYIKSQLMK